MLSSKADDWIGKTAPKFSHPDETGKEVSLDGLLAGGPVMLVFYPGDFTPVCTKQLCSYQDSYEGFRGLGVQIAGISHDDRESHRNFRKRYGLSFPLLSDPGKETFRAYGVTSLFMFGAASRAVFVISRSGKIVYRHVEPTVLTHRKPGELLEALQSLSAKKML